MKVENKLKWEKLKKWLSSENLTVTLYILRAVWYLTCFTFCSYYVVSNWDTMSKVTFFDGITLESVIFFMLVGLTIMPFIKKIELIGFKVETNMSLSEALNEDVKEKLENVVVLPENQENLLKEIENEIN